LYRFSKRHSGQKISFLESFELKLAASGTNLMFKFRARRRTLPFGLPPPRKFHWLSMHENFLFESTPGSAHSPRNRINELHSNAIWSVFFATAGNLNFDPKAIQNETLNRSLPRVSARRQP
jgi:hypothetical protein